MAHSKDKLKLQHIQRVVEKQLERYMEKLNTCDLSEAPVVDGQIRILNWVLGYFTFEDGCKRGAELQKQKRVHKLCGRSFEDCDCE